MTSSLGLVARAVSDSVGLGTMVNSLVTLIRDNPNSLIPLYDHHSEHL